MRHIKSLSFIISVAAFALGARSTCAAQIPITLSSKDIYSLAERIQHALRNCDPLKSHPRLSVVLENRTGEMIDEPRFTDLIRNFIEQKTNRFPDKKASDTSVRCLLTVSEKQSASLVKTEYRLSAQVFREGNKLCDTSVKLKKKARVSETHER